MSLRRHFAAVASLILAWVYPRTHQPVITSSAFHPDFDGQYMADTGEIFELVPQSSVPLSAAQCCMELEVSGGISQPARVSDNP